MCHPGVAITKTFWTAYAALRCPPSKNASSPGENGSSEKGSKEHAERHVHFGGGSGACAPEVYTLHPTPYTLHPTPYTLHPTPYTLLPTPYTLDPTLQTLNPKPNTLDLPPRS